MKIHDKPVWFVMQYHQGQVPGITITEGTGALTNGLGALESSLLFCYSLTCNGLGALSCPFKMALKTGTLQNISRPVKYMLLLKAKWSCWMLCFSTLKFEPNWTYMVFEKLMFKDSLYSISIAFANWYIDEVNEENWQNMLMINFGARGWVQRGCTHNTLVKGYGMSL